VLLLDDAHKLTGRKLDVVLQLCRECSRLVIGTWSEQSLPMSLRMLLDRRDPQRIHLLPRRLSFQRSRCFRIRRNNGAPDILRRTCL
jgi:hypothetical protein